MEKWTQAIIIPGQTFEARVSGTGQQTVHDCDPWEEGSRGDKLHIYLGFLPRDTFQTAAQGSGDQRGSHWVEEAEIWGDRYGRNLCSRVLKKKCTERELQKCAQGFLGVFSRIFIFLSYREQIPQHTQTLPKTVFCEQERVSEGCIVPGDVGIPTNQRKEILLNTPKIWLTLPRTVL